jgi:hypothetical protein
MKNRNGNTRDKSKTEEKKKSELQDLEPTKDAKGGIPPGPCGPGGRGSSGGNLPAVQGPRGNN